MMKKIRLLADSLRLVWKSAPAWASVNVAVSVVRGFLPLILLFLLKHLIDSVTSSIGSGPPEGLLWLIVSVVALFFLDEISGEFANFARKKQAFRLESYMYDLLHQKAVSIDLIHFERPASFDLLSRATREAPWRPASILNNAVSLFRGLLSLILMAGLLFSLHWWLAVLLLAVNIPGIWLRLHYADVIYNFQRKQTPEARRSAYFNWLLTGDRPARELRLFGLGSYFRALFRKSFTKQKEEEITIIRKRTSIEVFSGIFKAGALLAALWFISVKTISGNISLGEMTMLILAFRQGMLYLREILGSLAGLYEDTLFTGDIFEFLNLPQRPAFAEKTGEEASLRDKITVDSLSFSYPGNAGPAISNVSFDLKKGEVIAFVGPNGAGKSTLAKLICNLYDASGGNILFDGRNIKDIDPSDYSKNFSVVFQDFMLYNLTAGENIRLGDVDRPASPAGIESSAKAGGIDDLIRSFPEGYDTSIGNLFNDSRELSWGEWQKIAIARALYRQSPVLILDEPSSALDPDTENEIFSRFRDITRGRTSILISHRFTNVKIADRIIVLNRGSVEESGTHEELMNRKGMYYNMYRKQSERFSDEELS